LFLNILLVISFKGLAKILFLVFDVYLFLTFAFSLNYKTNSHPMKKIIAYFVLYFIGLGFLQAQSDLYCITGFGGEEFGSILRMPLGGNTISSQYNFQGNPGSNTNYSSCVEVNGKLYGTTRQGGIMNGGIIYEYEIATGLYVKKFDFNSTDGYRPESGMITASNGKLYGLTRLGGSSFKGVIYEFHTLANRRRYRRLARQLDHEDRRPAGHPAERDRRYRRRLHRRLADLADGGYRYDQ